MVPLTPHSSPYIVQRLLTHSCPGMGNRFRELPGYHSLIRAHGVIAAITFLGCVPAAILILRFYGRNPRSALRFHIWLQVVTLLLATVVFVLGWVAVGPSRSLTNPHHAIGLTIYVLIWFQVIAGWWVHKREKGKRRLYEPLKVMVRLPDDISSLCIILTMHRFIIGSVAPSPC